MLVLIAFASATAPHARPASTMPMITAYSADEAPEQFLAICLESLKIGNVSLVFRKPSLHFRYISEDAQMVGRDGHRSRADRRNCRGHAHAAAT
jgi:hypothetical protein